MVSIIDGLRTEKLVNYFLESPKMETGYRLIGGKEIYEISLLFTILWGKHFYISLLSDNGTTTNKKENKEDDPDILFSGFSNNQFHFPLFVVINLMIQFGK